MLYLPGNQQSRLAVRAASFLISIAAFWFWYLDRRDKYPVRHPATRWLTVVTMLLFLMVIHPETASLLAGFGHIALYFSVFSPMFWVPAFVDSRRRLIRVLAILMVCTGVTPSSACCRSTTPTWMPAEFSFGLAAPDRDCHMRRAERPQDRPPPGLFDTPGAVCGAGAAWRCSG